AAQRHDGALAEPLDDRVDRLGEDRAAVSAGRSVVAWLCTCIGHDAPGDARHVPRPGSGISSTCRPEHRDMAHRSATLSGPLATLPAAPSGVAEGVKKS